MNFGTFQINGLGVERVEKSVEFFNDGQDELTLFVAFHSHIEADLDAFSLFYDPKGGSEALRHGTQIQYKSRMEEEGRSYYASIYQVSVNAKSSLRLVVRIKPIVSDYKFGSEIEEKAAAMHINAYHPSHCRTFIPYIMYPDLTV